MTDEQWKKIMPKLQENIRKRIAEHAADIAFDEQSNVNGYIGNPNPCGIIDCEGQDYHVEFETTKKGVKDLDKSLEEIKSRRDAELISVMYALHKKQREHEIGDTVFFDDGDKLIKGVVIGYFPAVDPYAKGVEINETDDGVSLRFEWFYFVQEAGDFVAKLKRENIIKPEDVDKYAEIKSQEMKKAFTKYI